MKISEEKYLKSAISNIKRYTKEYPLANDFFNKLNNLQLLSLQELSFKSDLKLFDEFSLILSVITTIISKPHISTKGEETILRADQVGYIQPEMFAKTMQDSPLWKRKNDEMVPEHVHYYETIDNLKIYENIFIVMVIDLIDNELAKYMDFYISVLQRFDGQSRLTYELDNEELAISKIEVLDKRIKRIKNTNFYREVSKAKRIVGHITPTNILLKDRLYNLCYKFYKEMVTYEDKSSLIDDFILYYYTILITELKRAGFKMNVKTKQASISLDKRGNMDLYQPLSFLSNDFKITISRNRVYDGIELEIVNREISDKNINTSTHLLLIDSGTNFADVERSTRTKFLFDFTSVEAISLWNMAYLSKEPIPMYNQSYTSAEMIVKWLNSKMSKTLASTRIYSFYCPICKNKDVSGKDGIYTCNDCNSVYTFYKVDADTKLWFKKIGRC